jgi:aryl-alcohol dehydrogenase-like predicted oxidoreductase
MDHRRLGRSGLHISTLCLGTMMFGDQTTEREATEIVAAARDAGVNFLDTADRYAMGRSEEILGRCVSGERDRWVVATKVYGAMGGGPNQHGLGRKWIMEEVRHSLRRLGTDYIDLYYLHHPDHDTPLEETVMAFGDLIRRGDIRYWGVSNHKAWRIAEMCAIADRLGIPRPIAAQPVYNATNRTAEVELLPACAHFGLGVVPYSPLARGVLTGKYRPGEAPPEGTRAGRKDRRMLQAEWRDDSLILAQRVAEYARSRNVTPVGLALNWVLNNAAATSVIAGPRTMEQWRSYLAVLDEPFGAEDEAFFDSLVPAGHVSTQFFTDPTDPVLGRVRRV